MKRFWATSRTRKRTSKSASGWTVPFAIWRKETRTSKRSTQSSDQGGGDLKSPASLGRRLKIAAPCSANPASGLAFVKNVFVVAQSRLFRIAPDIAHTIREVLLVANETIEIIPLPQGSRSFYELIDFARGKTLPTLNQFL